MDSAIRRAAVAGSWYPGTAADIKAEVDGYVTAARNPQVPGRLVALVSPHAGLRYSGPVAAHGYRLLRDRPVSTVVLVGPSHRAAFDGVALFAGGAFETPLGRVLIAEDIAAALLAADPTIEENPGVHRDEHSLEMQLPFLQHVVPKPNLRIVPLLMGSQSREEVDALAGALARTLAGRDVLLVASSDLSHYLPASVANRVDARVVDLMARFDPESLMGLLERGHVIEAARGGVACGGGPMVAVMKAARVLGAARATVLKYGDSGDVGEHDKGRVVGYLSAALSADS